MKKTIGLIVTAILVFSVLTGTVQAADEYSFDLEYMGKIVVDEEKDASVTLTGVGGPTYTNVRIKVDIQGPEKPELIAYDSSGNRIDIAKEGYWGPPTGFAVQGSFVNRTPLKATFTKAGTYIIRLSLIDIANNDNVITAKDFTLEVSEIEVENNTVEENKITEIPQTGWSYGEMVICVVSILAILAVMYIAYTKKIKE